MLQGASTWAEGCGKAECDAVAVQAELLCVEMLRGVLPFYTHIKTFGVTQQCQVAGGQQWERRVTEGGEAPASDDSFCAYSNA